MSGQGTQNQNMLEKSQLVSIINSVLGKISPAQIPGGQEIYQDILDLREMIESLRLDLRSAATGDILENHVPSATDELDSITTLTEQATHAIMNACDAMQAHINAQAPLDRAFLKRHIIAIYESCTFQDITGQRVAKVVSALKKIETATRNMLDSFAYDAHEQPANNENDAVEAGLMNGPQLPGQGVTQDEVDRILSTLGE